MSIYTKNQSVGGKWVNKKELRSGTKAVIVSETAPMPSTFTDDEGKTKTQDVCKVRFDGQSEPVNVALNRPNIDGLVDAFGEDSARWQGKPLTAEVMKALVAGKMVRILYLVPEGYITEEDAEGFVHIVKATDVVDGSRPPLDEEPPADGPRHGEPPF